MPEQQTKSTMVDEGQRQADAKPMAESEPGEPILNPAAELPPPDSESEEPGEAAAGANAAGAPGPAAVVSAAELEKLKAERDQLLDRLARLQAEFDNARKRAERERQDFRDYSTGNVVEQFLPVIDNFELALKSTGTADQLRAGVSLIVKQMEEILARMQVTPVPAVGEPFDPRLHEALGSVDCDDIPDQHVAQEIRRGYKLREKLLRPALVRVAHNSKQMNE